MNQEKCEKGECNMLDGHNHISCMSCISCHTSPKEEIVNDWESEFKEKFAMKDWNIYIEHATLVEDQLSFIRKLLSSTEKRVAKEIIEILQTSNFVEPNLPRALENIIDKIKSKYE